KEAYDLLLTKYQTNRPILVKEIIKTLAMENIDIYGNGVKLTIFEGQGFTLSDIPNDRMNQIFIVAFTSGKANNFGGGTAWYTNDPEKVSSPFYEYWGKEDSALFRN
ncbi:hypothetical protein J7L05_12585, partial [bacterium]|nr:hypothetical protein [bacterium]